MSRNEQYYSTNIDERGEILPLGDDDEPSQDFQLFILFLFAWLRYRMSIVESDDVDLSKFAGSCPDINAASTTTNRTRNVPRAYIDKSILTAAEGWAEKLVEKFNGDFQDEVTGRLGEYAAATYFGTAVNRTIYGSYQGDNGVDFTAGGWRWDAKTTLHESAGDHEWRVGFGSIGRSDCFCFCSWDPHHKIVYLQGFMLASDLLLFGDFSPSQECIYVQERDLRNLEPTEIQPSMIKEQQSGEFEDKRKNA